MSTTSKAVFSKINDSICQGDIFNNVKFSYIDSEDNVSVNIIEYEFPYAVIISQACDVIAMEKVITNKGGKPSKFMPSVLLCPIYDKESAKSDIHIEDMFSELGLFMDKEPICFSHDLKIANKDWHYRFHAFNVSVEDKAILKDMIIDFKHYFSVPISYLISNKKNRILHLDDLYAEQLTLKFSTYLSRVAIPK